MNGFETHGIRHSSVSQINTWEANPALWVAEKLLGKKRSASPAMWRGIAVENAVVDCVTETRDLPDAINAALEFYDDKITLADEKSEKERAAIDPMTRLAVDELKAFGKPDFSVAGEQEKVEVICSGDGWKLPIIGYLDLVYPEHGLVVDLKTTFRLPSSMTVGHRRQRCLYDRCTGNQSVKFLYVTPKKFGWLEDGDVDEELAAIKAHLNRLERFLSISDDPEYLASIVPVDPSHFYWGDCIDMRKEVFGL